MPLCEPLAPSMIVANGRYVVDAADVSARQAERNAR